MKHSVFGAAIIWRDESGDLGESTSVLVKGKYKNQNICFVFHIGVFVISYLQKGRMEGKKRLSSYEAKYASFNKTILVVMY